MIRHACVLLSAIVPLAAMCPCSSAADWPAYLQDNARSGAGADSLRLPLKPAWMHAAQEAPQPAWPGPAKQDYWHNKHDLNPRVTYDSAFQVVAAGDAAFYGSSSDDQVHCLDARTGKQRWSFFTGGPVRLAPVVAGDCVLAGSDDGWVYCLSAADGRLKWRYRPGASDACMIGNGRVISRWPVRTGLAVEGGIAYCAAGLFPVSEGVYLAAFDVATGREVWKQKIDQSAQGYLAAAGGRLYLPSGRTAPGIYSRADGKHLGDAASPGGDYCLVDGDAVIAGPGDTDGQLAVSGPDSEKPITTLKGVRLVAAKDRFYVLSRTDLAALDRTRYLALARQRTALQARLKAVPNRRDEAGKAEAAKLKQQIAEVSTAMDGLWLWRTPCAGAGALIRAGELLFAGGDGLVAAYDAGSGKELWSAAVAGMAYGLAAAGGRLLVSTDQGVIYGFEYDEGQAKRLAAGGKKGGGNPVAGVAAAVPPLPAPVRPLAGPAPYAADGQSAAYQEAAAAILKEGGTGPGYCLVLGAGEGRLALEIARQSKLHVIGVERDPAKVEAGRKALAAAGMYGRRVVLHLGEADRLPYPACFANLVVIEGAAAGKAAVPAGEVFRVLRPCGGAIVASRPRGGQPDAAALDQWLAALKRAGAEVGAGKAGDRWAIARRGPLEGAGEWTHGLADPGNTSCSMDRRVAGPLAVQWFGAPGPRDMADRHHRNPPPLYKDGRLFVPGNECVIAVDAYNGAELWRREIPDSLRLGVFLDSSNMAVDEGALCFAAQGACHLFDVATGRTQRTVAVPPPWDTGKRSWGYLASVGGLLVGSGRKPTAGYEQQSHQADALLWGDRMGLVTSDCLFAFGRTDAALRWTYQGGLILNTTLAIGGGRIYFVETRAPQALANAVGRVPMSSLADGPNDLVALDLGTGKAAWRRPFDPDNFRHIAYLDYAQGMLVLSGNKYVDKKLWYWLYGIDAATGSTVWERSHNAGYGPGGQHGEQNRHPAVVGDVVYAYPLAYRLRDGEPVEEWKFSRQGNGCGEVSASAYSLFWRGGNPWMWDLRPGGQSARVNSVTRPGCWINAIPAGGMLLIPEASSGCTCGYPLQTSITYMPVRDPPTR